MPNPPVKPPTGGAKKLGGVDTKWWVIGGVGAVGIVWYATKHTKSSTATTATDPTIDPTTGLPYADSTPIDPYATSAYDSGGYYGGGGGSGAASLPTTDLQGNTTDPQTTQAWLLEAESALLSMGFNPNAVSTALGNFNATGTDPTGAIASAAGAVGAPPGGASSGSTATATQPAPQPAPAPAPAPAPKPLPTMTAPSLHGTATTDHKAKFTWTAVAGAKGYNIYYAGVYHMYHTDTEFESASHAVGSKYGPITVRAIRAADGHPGPASNAVTVTIK